MPHVYGGTIWHAPKTADRLSYQLTDVAVNEKQSYNKKYLLCTELLPNSPTWPQDCTIFFLQLNTVYNETRKSMGLKLTPL